MQNSHLGRALRQLQVRLDNSVIVRYLNVLELEMPYQWSGGVRVQWSTSCGATNNVLPSPRTGFLCPYLVVSWKRAAQDETQREGFTRDMRPKDGVKQAHLQAVLVAAILCYCTITKQGNSLTRWWNIVASG